MNEYGKLKTLSLLLVALCCIPLAASGQGDVYKRQVL